jgi:glycosyltransferase EpsD
MKKKILFVASVSSHIKAFHLPYLKWFQERGFETHVACRDTVDSPFVDKHWQIPFARTPYSKDNLRAYKKLKAVIESNNFALINCHTPVASVLTRLASKAARKNGTKLIYSAHGFHFFKGASWQYWLLYYPIEVWFSGMTDAIVCVNVEDYDRIRRKGSKACDYYLVPGNGVDTKRFFKVGKEERDCIRQRNNIDLNAFVVVYSAEFTERKNHRFIIRAIRENEKHLGSNIKFLFAGKGEAEEAIKDMVKKYGLDDKIQFLGFRSDIDQVYKMADIGISSSRQEGRANNVIEEMMCGLPVIATMIRGHNDIINNRQNGFLFAQGNASQFIDLILLLKDDKELYRSFSQNAIIRANEFELSKVLESTTSVYLRYL